MAGHLVWTREKPFLTVGQLVRLDWLATVRIVSIEEMNVSVLTGDPM